MEINKKNMGKLMSNIDLKEETSTKSSINIDFEKL